MSLWDEGRLGADRKQILTSSLHLPCSSPREARMSAFHRGWIPVLFSLHLETYFGNERLYIRMHVCVHIYIHTYTYITRTVRTQNVSVCVSWESYHIWQRCGWRLKLILNFCQVLWASGSPKQSMMISHTESLSLNNQWSWKWFKFITLPGQPSVASVGVFVRRLHIPVNLIYSSMLYGVRHFSWDICVCAHI